MNDIDFNTLFAPLWSDISSEESFPTERPLLAHYTSISTLERIMDSDELWFSNPLYMNDLEELRFGMNQGARAFREHQGIERACGGEERYRILQHAFEHYFQEFDDKHAFDTYVLCFSQHEPQDTDGLLSMWRGYGGNGNGAAIVIDTAQLTAYEGSPFIIAKVTYATREERLQWIENKLQEFAALLEKTAVPDEKIYIAAYALLERLKIFALFTKHSGFHEEREWRVVYLNQRDIEQKIKCMFHYGVGPRGVEPKLKFKLGYIEGVIAEDISLEKIVTRIILGPSLSTPLALKSVHRMLESVKKGVLVDRVVASSTPFRSN